MHQKTMNQGDPLMYLNAMIVNNHKGSYMWFGLVHYSHKKQPK